MTFDNCIFEANEVVWPGKGGAGWIEESSATFTNCIFRDNSSSVDHGGGGIVVQGPMPDGPIIFDSCSFIGNYSYGVGGGLLAIFFAEVSLANCTFYGNEAQYHAAGIGVAAGSGATLANTIIAFNVGGEAAHCDPQSTPSWIDVSCCDFYGNPVGDWTGCVLDQYGEDGNISEDPLFCDAPNGNFRLLEASPCAPNSPPNPECSRIGAWPVGCEVSAVDDPPGSRPFATLGQLVSAPNPFGALSRITYDVPRSSVVTRTLITVHDAAGRVVRTLVDSYRPAGTYCVEWDGSDATGAHMMGGIYFYRLRLGDETVTKPMVLLR